MACGKCRLDRREQGIAGGFFRQIDGASSLSHGLNHLLRFVDGKPDYGHMRKLHLDFLCCLNAAHLWQGDIHQDHIRSQFTHELDCGLPIACFAHHFNVLVRIQNAPYACSYDLMIINNQHANAESRFSHLH